MIYRSAPRRACSTRVDHDWNQVTDMGGYRIGFGLGYGRGTYQFAVRGTRDKQSVPVQTCDLEEGGL